MSDGTMSLVQTPEGMRFEPIVKPEPTGQAYVEPEKAKTRRDLEMEAGRKRVAEATELVKNRPPRIVSDAEKRAQGTNTPIFRPNTVHADRVVQHNGAPVSQAVGAVMRRVGAAKEGASG